jgi:hypothetical protein
MPTLLIHHSDQARGVVLVGRLLIGRVAPANLIFPDNEVSRIHAWIDQNEEGHYYVADAGSRAGTIVDEFPIEGRRILRDEDEIRIGSAIITYLTADSVPEGIAQLAIAPSSRDPMPAAGGMVFACTCGAPLWAPLEWGGRRGKCTVCGQRTEVPRLAIAQPPPTAVPLPVSAPIVPGAVEIAVRAPAPEPATAVARATRQCSICQWNIDPGDSEQACPSCGLTFHAECWEANKGCSAYGCASVEVLADPASEPAAAPIPATVEEIAPERFPMEFAMLGGSVLCSLIGLITFGIPSLLLAIGTSFYWITQRRRGEEVKNGIVAAAMALCISGICAGLWFSAFRWLHRPLAAPWQHVS